MSAQVRAKYERLSSLMDEKLKRHWAACEAVALGRGGISAVSRATGLSRHTIRRGIREIEEGMPQLAEELAGRVRRAGGGRKALREMDATLIADLEELLEATTRGDPTSPLLWTCKSTRKLAEELQRRGHRISHTTVDHLLHSLGYSLQANRKTQEGKQHPDRNAQFEFITRKVRRFQNRHQPVISVDGKKKETLGNLKNSGREWRRKGCPEPVKVHDFPDKVLGKAIPYGLFDPARNEGWVAVGIDHDTAEFAVATITRWWFRMGHRAYPHARELLITADAGGSNGYRLRLWKYCLQKLADQSGLAITVCHFPPGTSKWNKIEHRMFCHISENWRGRPLISHAVVVNLIGHTTTRTGLHIHAELDTKNYRKGIKVSDEAFATIQMKKDAFHGDWNYTIRPRE